MKILKRLTFLTSIILFTSAVLSASATANTDIHIVTSQEISDPVKFGIEELKKAFGDKGFIIHDTNTMPKKIKGIVFVAGTSEQCKILLKNSKEIRFPDTPEALLIKIIQQKKVNLILASGSDSRGTMYALLELAKQIQSMPDESDILNFITEIREQPFSPERSLSTSIGANHILKGFWHDKNYWDKLFKQLAYSRINYYNIIFKTRPPIYTLFFDVEGFDRTNLGGSIIITNEQQDKNLESMRYIAQAAHRHGVSLTLGIWNHVHNPAAADDMAAYTEAAIAKIIKLVPFDAFQFRMHWESGLPRDPETLRRFWGRVFDGINSADRPIRIYIRAKGLPNLVVEVAVEKKIDFAIETKYMGEQMGMPFHPGHIQVENQFDRRHGYADLLTHPKRYDIQWRSWNRGSQKLLTWGSVDYTRKWVKSTGLYNNKGIFEIMEIEGAEPMGNGSVRCLNDEYIYTDYEFQRYWYHNMLYGRLGYNPEASQNVFKREFIERFGPETGPIVMQAMEEAGMIIPRIIGSAMPDFQQARGCPEWGSGSGLYGKALLEEYAKIRPSDVQTFISFNEAAKFIIEGTESGRIWPQKTAAWHKSTSKNVLKLVSQAKETMGSNTNKELTATLNDLKILAGMSKFHSIRIEAALAYNLYELMDSSSAALQLAIACDEKALEAYREVVSTVGNLYRTDLDISVSDAGHWKDELALLEEALEKLKSKPSKNNNTPLPDLQLFDKPGDNHPPVVKHEAIQGIELGKDVDITADISDESGVKWARLLYRGVTQFQEFQTIELQSSGDSYRASIPAKNVASVVEYNNETGAIWDFMYFIEVMDSEGNGCTYPSIEDEAPYIFVPVPHKTIEETKGKITYSKIKDKTYTPQFHDIRQFEITMPINNDVFMSGADINVKMNCPWEYDPSEKVEIIVYVNNVEVDAEKTGDMEYVIKDLDNGLYRINAHVKKIAYSAWSNTVEIVVGTTRK